jgi:hypothetical protein
MITSDIRSRWGKVSTIEHDAFGCMISTAPGVFKGSILVMAFKPDGSVNRMPVAKAYLKRSLSRADRDNIHDHIVNDLDTWGVANIGMSLRQAIEHTFSMAKAEGHILDYIAHTPHSR